jgi:signal peptidase I
MDMKILWNRSIGDNIRFRNMEYTIITDGADCYPWIEYFAILPRKTVTGKRIFWEKAYKRKVWVVWGTGFHMEPETQYATVFDLLVYDNKHKT